MGASTIRSSMVAALGGLVAVPDIARSLANGTTNFDAIKARADEISSDDLGVALFGVDGANFIDNVAAETAKLGVFNTEISKLYDAAKVNSSTDFKNPDESQRMTQARSAAAGSRVAMASASGSALSRASTTAVQAEAAKRTLLGE